MKKAPWDPRHLAERSPYTRIQTITGYNHIKWHVVSIFYVFLHSKNFVKVTVLLNKWVTKELIWRKKNWWERISSFSILSSATVWKLRKFTLTHFSQEFRESNICTYVHTYVLKSWFDEKSFGETKSFIFPHCAVLLNSHVGWKIITNAYVMLVK